MVLLINGSDFDMGPPFKTFISHKNYSMEIAVGIWIRIAFKLVEEPDSAQIINEIIICVRV